MIQKTLAVVVAALLVVIMSLGVQLHSASGDVATLTSERDAAKQEASNARAAQQTAEAQNQVMLLGFQMLDKRLGQLGDTQRQNTQWLARQMAGLNTIQKQPGDSDESFQCLDAAVPRDLDQWLRNDGQPAGPNGGH